MSTILLMVRNSRCRCLGFVAMCIVAWIEVQSSRLTHEHAPFNADAVVYNTQSGHWVDDGSAGWVTAKPYSKMRARTHTTRSWRSCRRWPRQVASWMCPAEVAHLLGDLQSLVTMLSPRIW